MKNLIVAVLMLALFSGCLMAELTQDQWEIDHGLFQEYLNSSPKNYLGAVNLTRKWIQYAHASPDAVEAIAGAGITEESLQSVLNNLYLEVGQVVCGSYNELMQGNQIQAAEFAIGVKRFFDENPILLEELAAAHNSTVEHMNDVMESGLRSAITSTFNSCSQAYSSLKAEGKFDEAAALSRDWQRVVSAWDANLSPLSEAFRDVTEMSATEIVDELRDFERDYAQWRDAVANGNEELAMQLVDKWISRESVDPQVASAISHLVFGTEMNSQTEWAIGFKVATYAALWSYDLNSYRQAIGAGRLDDALALVAKWENIFAGQYGKALAAHLGSDVAAMTQGLADERQRISSVDTSFASESVDSFRADLAAHGEAAARQAAAEPGSDEWYAAAAQAVELADKWSRIAEQNPSLASEIAGATGIHLPQDADNDIRQRLLCTVGNSAQIFNGMMGCANLEGAKNLIDAWQSFLSDKPTASRIANETWPGLEETLDRLSRGLGVMIGVTGVSSAGSAAETAASQQEAGATSTTGATTFGPSGN